MLPQTEDDRTISQVGGSTMEVKMNTLQRGRWEEFDFTWVDLQMNLCERSGIKFEN